MVKSLKFLSFLGTYCPACKEVHLINVINPERPHWGYVEDENGLTVTPSVNIIGRCHFHIKKNKIEYCADCNHDMKGQVVDLPDIPQEELDFYGSS